MHRHPLRTAGLATCVIGGAILGATFLPDDLATARRVVGGGLLGGLSWLIPNFGRIIDGG